MTNSTKAIEQVCNLRGVLLGTVCQALGVYDTIGGARVALVPAPGEGAKPGQRAATGADLKPVIRSISDKEFAQHAAKGLETKTDANGMLCIHEDRYAGQPLDVYVCIESVPLHGADPRQLPLQSPACFYLGRYQPFGVASLWYLILIMPAKVWCDLKRRADVWTIAGRVTSCERGEALGQVIVEALDVDIVQDDMLGSATTNANGIFRIDYLGEAYRQGTLIDVELFGGPDVYFKVKSQTGELLIDEPRSKGRSRGRCNSSPCLCVELCVALWDEPGGPTGVNAWTGIGEAFSVPDAANLNSFDADGYAGAAKYALTGAIRMLGSVDYVDAGAGAQQGFTDGAGNPIRYRFLVSETAGRNTIPQAPVPVAQFTRIVGALAAPDRALFNEVKLGEMVRSSPLKKIPILSAIQDIDDDGWFDPNKAILRTFLDPSLQRLGVGEPPLTPADLPQFSFTWVGGALMGIDTSRLTTQPDVPLAGLTTGDAVPSPIALERFAFRFEVRSFDDATGASWPLPTDGTQLDAAVINNNHEVKLVAMKEHLAQTPCTPLSGPVHVAYSVHHPHLRSVTLTVDSNDGSYHANLADPPLLPLSANIDAAATSLNHGSLLVPAVSNGVALKRCTYLVWLAVTLRLHNGDSADLPSHAVTSFYWEP